MVGTQDLATPKASRETGMARGHPGKGAPVETMRFFEVHKYTGGRWELAFVFDDRESALSAAEMMLAASRMPMGVRVLRVLCQEDRAGNITFSDQTIFRQSTTDRPSANGPNADGSDAGGLGSETDAGAMRAWQEVEAARAKRRLERVQERARIAAAARPSDLLRVILRLTVLAWVVVAAMVIARHRFF